MKLAVLFSGGKDSFLAYLKAKEKNEVACLISIVSKNEESYMFHTPNIHLVDLNAQALEVPIIKVKTTGEKEKELADLKKAIKSAIKKYRIEGIVSGAIASTYQASRLQKICNDLDIWCFNPLWQRDQVSILNEIISKKIKVIIAGVFAYPLDETFLGKELDNDMIAKLIKLSEEYKINPAGEGGEIETLVLDSPLHKKRLEIKRAEKEYKNHAGIYKIIDAELARK